MGQIDKVMDSNTCIVWIPGEDIGKPRLYPDGVGGSFQLRASLLVSKTDKISIFIDDLSKTLSF